MLESVVYLLAYLLTELISYLLAYVIIFRASVNKEKKRWFMGVGIILIIHGIVMYYGGEIASSNISMFTMVVIPMFLLGKTEKKNFFLYPFIFMSTSAIGIGISFILALIMDIPEHRMVEESWLTLMCQSVTTIMLLIIFMYRNFKGYKKIQIQLSMQQYVLFYVTTVCLFLMLATMQSISGGDLSLVNINACGFAISVASITFVILVLWQGIVVNNEIQLRERNATNEKYIEMQKKHFDEIMKQDEEIRRFRHDMKAHMMIIKSFCENANNEKLNGYLESMIKESTVSEEQYTGNMGIDAVIRELFTEAKSKNIKIEFNGALPEDIKIPLYDYCTIISNILKNAIEASEKIEDISGRIIKVDICMYNALLFINIENTVLENVIIKNNKLVTSKLDKKNHGFGSGNVENAVKNNNGEIKYKCENGWFKTEIRI